MEVYRRVHSHLNRKGNGDVYADADAMRTKLLETARLSNGYLEEHPLSQPVKVKFNGNGSVKCIDTLVYNEGKEEKNKMHDKLINCVLCFGNKKYLSGIYNLSMFVSTE